MGIFFESRIPKLPLVCSLPPVADIAYPRETVEASDADAAIKASAGEWGSFTKLSKGTDGGSWPVAVRALDTDRRLSPGDSLLLTVAGVGSWSE
jgi:hypothetical protein